MKKLTQMKSRLAGGKEFKMKANLNFFKQRPSFAPIEQLVFRAQKLSSELALKKELESQEKGSSEAQQFNKKISEPHLKKSYRKSKSFLDKKIDKTYHARETIRKKFSNLKKSEISSRMSPVAQKKRILKTIKKRKDEILKMINLGKRSMDHPSRTISTLSSYNIFSRADSMILHGRRARMRGMTKSQLISGREPSDTSAAGRNRKIEAAKVRNSKILATMYSRELDQILPNKKKKRKKRKHGEPSMESQVEEMLSEGMEPLEGAQEKDLGVMMSARKGSIVQQPNLDDYSLQNFVNKLDHMEDLEKEVRPNRAQRDHLFDL